RGYSAWEKCIDLHTWLAHTRTGTDTHRVRQRDREKQRDTQTHTHTHTHTHTRTHTHTHTHTQRTMTTHEINVSSTKGPSTRKCIHFSFFFFQSLHLSFLRPQIS